MDQTDGAAPCPAGADRRQDAAAGTTWIFGYGSLMWKPDFAFRQSCRARLHGYHRSLCVYSWVHRGTEQRPGLVFGLDRGGACKGIAFEIAPEQEAEIVARLDERELVTAVYRRRRLMIATEHGRVPAWCYVVRRDHAQYAGRLPEAELLAMIERGEGRSGRCRDYVLSTVAHLEALGVNDAVLASVARRLLARARPAVADFSRRAAPAPAAPDPCAAAADADRPPRPRRPGPRRRR
jgi:cation transport protein ChaC